MPNDITVTKNWLKYCEKIQDIPPKYIQFMILWIAFNSFYSEKYTNGGDKSKVEQFAKDKFVKKMFNRLKNDAMSDILKDFKATKHSKRECVLDMRHTNGNNKKFFTEDKQSAEDFFMAVYQVRCNLFHGDKIINDECDKKIVGWAYNYLKIFFGEYIKSYQKRKKYVCL